MRHAVLSRARRALQAHGGVRQGRRHLVPRRHSIHSVCIKYPFAHVADLRSLCGFPPFSDDRKHLPLVEQIRKGDYNFPSPWWDAVDPAAIDLVKRMLQVDPAARITVEGALSHPWVARGGARVPATVATQTTGRRPLTREETALNPVHIARPQVAQPISAPRRPPPPAAAAAAAAPAAKRKGTAAR